MQRVVAIGIDSAEWWLLEQLADDGTLPNIARLRDSGARCELRNTSVFRTGLVWKEFVIGRHVEDRRPRNTMCFDESNYEAYIVPSRPETPFFGRAGAVPTIAIDVPHLTVSPDAPGVRVCAWGAHAPEYPRASSPRELLAEIDQRFGPHPAFLNDIPRGWYRRDAVERIVPKLVEGARKRLEIATWLQSKVPEWRLELVVMGEVHSAAEYMWHGVDASHPFADDDHAAWAREKLTTVLRGVDDAIGRFVAGLSTDDVVVLFAIHGVKPGHGDTPSVVLLPELLHRLEFGRPYLRDPDQDAWRTAGYPPFVPPGEPAWGSYMLSRRPDAPALQRFVSTVRPRLPRWALETWRTTNLRRMQRKGRFGTEGNPIPEPLYESDDEIARRRDTLDFQPPGWYAPRRSQMRAFALPSFSEGFVRLNLEGRERLGIVKASDYEAECDRVEEALGACSDPRSGAPAVKEIRRVRVDDPLDPDGPYADLEISWSGMMEAFDHPDVGMVGPFPAHRTGTHTPRGFLTVSGGGIDPRVGEPRAAIDAPATILHLAGAPTAGLDGEPWRLDV